MNYLMCTMTCTMTCIMTSFGVVGTEIVSVKRYVNRSVIQFRYQTNQYMLSEYHDLTEDNTRQVYLKTALAHPGPIMDANDDGDFS